MQFRSISKAKAVFEAERQKGKLSFDILRELYIKQGLSISEVGRLDGVSRQASFVRYYRFFVLNGCHHLTGREREKLATQKKHEAIREQNLKKNKKVQFVVATMEERGYQIKAFYPRPKTIRFIVNGHKCNCVFSRARFFNGAPYFRYDFHAGLLKNVKFIIFIGKEKIFKNVFIVRTKSIIKAYGRKKIRNIYIPVNGYSSKKPRLNFWRNCDNFQNSKLKK